jgi:hypothetical protein
MSMSLFAAAGGVAIIFAVAGAPAANVATSQDQKTAVLQPSSAGSHVHVLAPGSRSNVVEI